jgi:hypothetical protein
LANDVDEVKPIRGSNKGATDNATSNHIVSTRNGDDHADQAKARDEFAEPLSGPERIFVDAKNAGNPNIRFAAATPVIAPAICVVT